MAVKKKREEVVKVLRDIVIVFCVNVKCFIFLGLYIMLANVSASSPYLAFSYYC